MLCFIALFLFCRGSATRPSSDTHVAIHSGALLRNRYRLQDLLETSRGGESSPGIFGSEPPEIGADRAQLEMIGHVAKGSFGDVWRAVDQKRNNREVAVKIFYEKKPHLRYLTWSDAPEGSSLHQLLMSNVKECNTIKSITLQPLSRKLGAERICRCFEEHVTDAAADPEREPLFLVQEMCGQGLDRYIRERSKPVDLAMTKEYAIQLVEGLIFLQNLQPPIIHHDLKPENMAVDEKGLKFIDWGEMVIATPENEAQRPCPQSRTDVFAPPEGIGGNICFQMPSHSYDIYAAGLIILELLCPNLNHNDWTVTGADVRDPESRISPVPVELVKERCPELQEQADADSLIVIMKGMLHPEPARRPHPEEVLQQLLHDATEVTFYDNGLACFAGMKVKYNSVTHGTTENAIVTKCRTTTLDLAFPSFRVMKEDAALDRVVFTDWEEDEPLEMS